jgi:NAD(P)-dependent dehydrogenase (short-subunit alcohol dehydrogenase family)
MAKRVLITGTSTGFGRETAERLARRGDHVFATMCDSSGRNAAHREALARVAAQGQLRLRVLDLDVTDQTSVDSAIGATLQDAGGLDVVINNAGVAALGVTEAFTPEQFEQIFAANVTARFSRAARAADTVCRPAAR